MSGLPAASLLVVAICWVSLGSPAAAALTPEERRAVLEKHNELRRAEGAAGMPELVYDEEMEAQAERFAELCDFSHSSQVGGRYPVCANGACGQSHGENLYMKTGGSEAAWDAVVQAWYNEKSNYNLETRACSGVCGHYTQVVWANSLRLGCGKKTGCTCDNGQADCRKNMQVFLCQYDPPGNYAGAKPYKTGDICSECPMGFGCCEEGLCIGKPPAVEYTEGTYDYDQGCNDKVEEGLQLGQCYQDKLPFNPAGKVTMRLHNNVYKPTLQWCQDAACEGCQYKYPQDDGECQKKIGFNVKVTYRGPALPTKPGALESQAKGSCADLNTSGAVTRAGGGFSGWAAVATAAVALLLGLAASS